jgi:hypothetical protein
MLAGGEAHNCPRPLASVWAADCGERRTGVAGVDRRVLPRACHRTGLPCRKTFDAWPWCREPRPTKFILAEVGATISTTCANNSAKCANGYWEGQRHFCPARTYQSRWSGGHPDTAPETDRRSRTPRATDLLWSQVRILAGYLYFRFTREPGGHGAVRWRRSPCPTQHPSGRRLFRCEPGIAGSTSHRAAARRPGTRAGPHQPASIA